jgi:antibiotic biosynthesis monooxygenase (ABM) superfamily enzyme
MDRSTGPNASSRNRDAPLRSKDLATWMIVDHVNRESVSDYESWLNGIHGDLGKQHGFVSVDVIRHLDQPDPEYVILVKFEDQESISRWRSSPELASWLSKFEGLVTSDPRFEEAIGLELWLYKRRNNLAGAR